MFLCAANEGFGATVEDDVGSEVDVEVEAETVPAMKVLV
jgi:hypothetical protein